MELRLEDFNLRSVCVDLLKNFWVVQRKQRQCLFVPEPDQ